MGEVKLEMTFLVTNLLRFPFVTDVVKKFTDSIIMYQKKTFVLTYSYRNKGSFSIYMRILFQRILNFHLRVSRHKRPEIIEIHFIHY